MIPCVLCPWVCSEFIFSCGYISFDLIYQRYLKKVNIDLIQKINVMKYVQFCRDDFIRFDNDYECWLLNKKWTITPSVCIVRDEGMKFMVCKEHNGGSAKAYVHLLRQPNHILPCKYSDQICPAVIKLRTITQVKSNYNSNTYQMKEQRGNFNGIDTCNITQYRNFKFLSYLLEENESRSLLGRPDINALLDQFVKEKAIPPEFAENIRAIARVKNEDFNITKYSYGATYVPAKVATSMQQEDHVIPVICNNTGDDETRTSKNMVPIFPKYIYPVQKCDEYGSTPPLIPVLQHVTINTSMLWILIGIIT
jgi:hypothetical protein